MKAASSSPICVGEIYPAELGGPDRWEPGLVYTRARRTAARGVGAAIDESPTPWGTPMKALLTVIFCTSFLVFAGCGSSSGPSSSPVETIDDTTSQLDFGVEMARRGLWSEALFRFKQAERRQPGDPEILNNIAVAYEALGRFDDALAYYQRAIKSDPANKELKRNYSRFVEFYRNFRPEDQTGGEEQRAEGEGR